MQQATRPATSRFSLDEHCQRPWHGCSSRHQRSVSLDQASMEAVGRAPRQTFKAEVHVGTRCQCNTENRWGLNSRVQKTRHHASVQMCMSRGHELGNRCACFLLTTSRVGSSGLSN